MSGSDVGLVGTAARLEALAAIVRVRAELDAQETEVLASLYADCDPYGDGQPDLGKQWVREDVACALRVPSPVAASKLHTAAQLVSRFPATVASMRNAVMDAQRAHRLVEATIGLDDAAVAQVEKRVLARAGRQTYAQFVASVRRAVAAEDPRTAVQREVAAYLDRRVVFRPVDNAMTEMWALLPAEGALVLQQRVRQIADSWIPAGVDGAGDERTADQRRADALLALAGVGAGDTPLTDAALTDAARPEAADTDADADTDTDTDGGGGDVSGREVVRAVRPAVQVTVALSTLLGVDEQPGELAGHGPVSAELARALAFDPSGTWRRLVTDPAGNLVDVSSPTHLPSAGADGPAGAVA